AGVVSITLPVTLSKTIASTPLAFDDVGHVLTLSGGALDVNLTASTTLHLTFDTNTYTSNAGEAFHVATPFSVSFTAGLTATSVQATTTLGITKATATLKGLAVSAGITVAFKDPDAVGGITLDELQNTTASDLVTVGRTGSVAGKLDLDTTLIPGSPDAANIDIGDANLADGFSFTLPALTDFNPFTFTSPEALVAMLGQAAIALGGGQTSTDPALPFLKGTLRQLAQASRPVLDVVDSIGVICGATNQQPPSGSVQNLTIGDKAYCQAIVTTGVKAGSVTWTSNNATAGANASGANADGTAALSPSKNAEFTMTADGAIDAHVAYTATFDDDNNGTVDREVPGRTGQRPPRNVQDLATLVQSIGGFDALGDFLSYDPATKALSFHLKKTFDGAEINLPLSVGDQLESGTGVVGLSSTGGGITAKATGINLDLTAGVLLLPQNEWATVSGPGGCPDPANPVPCTSPLDLFFIKINPNSPEFSIGDAAFTLNSPTLRGQLGFLGVTAGVNNFGLTRSDSTKPVLTVDLTKAGDMTVNGVVLPNAVRLRELLFHIQDHVTISPLNLKLGGELKIDGTLNNQPVASATVGINWDLLTAGAPTITPSTDFAGLFANFNPVPNLFGQATGADSTTVLTASAAAFTDSAIGVQLHNVTDGSSCAVLSRTATTLTCTDPLAGGTDNTWQSGDLYRLEIGSPLALLGVLLDNLDQITNTIKNLTGVDAAGALDTELPIVGISPRQLLSQIDELRQTIDELRGDGSVVHCSLQPGAQVDPSQVVLDDQGKGTLYCNVTSLKPATAATWSATLLGLPGVTVTVDQPANPANSGGPNPTDQAVVHLTGTAGATIRQRHEEVAGNTTTDVGYQVHVTFTDVDGDHTEEYPSLAQPGTIQALEKAIKEKLGITQGFTLSLGDAPGGGGGKMISIDVNVGRCNDATLCDPADVNMGALSTSINADVSGLGGLVSAGSGGEIDVKYTAGARLKLGVTLDNGVPKVYVLPGTGVAVKGRFQATGLSFNATLGPFSVVAGTNARLNDQGTPETGDDVYDGNGVVKLGADLTIGQAITSPVAIGDFVSNLGTYLTPDFTAGPDQDCGSVTTSAGTDPVDTTDDTVIALGGPGVLGCGLLSIGIAAGTVTNYVADVGIKVELTNGQFIVTPAIPDDLLARFAAEALDLRLILAALPKLIGQVKDAMRASGAAATGNGKLPLIGDALDAGADVAKKLQDITQTLSDEIGNYVGGLNDPDAGLKSALQNLVFDKVGPSGLLMKPDGSATATAATDIEVITDCGGSCVGKSMTDLKDVRVIFGVGQSLVDTNVPFDLGLDGVPLRLVGSVHPKVTWSYVVDLGLNRTTGPYVGVKKPTGSSRPDSELNLTAEIGLGDNDAACSAVLPDPLTPLSNDPGGDSIIPGAWSEHRCLAGQLSFLGVQVRDGDGTDATKDQSSAVSLHVGLDLKNGNNDTLGLTNIDGVSLTPT
ncbi:MAG: hypothetical protein QOG69_3102, partial [Actinomycetota bacterium]|nr:hypothetical protein [Actinomycetota bacterium]